MFKFYILFYPQVIFHYNGQHIFFLFHFLSIARWKVIRFYIPAAELIELFSF